LERIRRHSCTVEEPRLIRCRRNVIGRTWATTRARPGLISGDHGKHRVGRRGVVDLVPLQYHAGKSFPCGEIPERTRTEPRRARYRRREPRR
jgi:hypothetical protein